MSRLLRLAVWRTQSRPSFFCTSIQRHCGSIGCRPSHDRRITVSHGQQTFASRGFSRFPGLFSRLPADNQKQNNEGPKTDPVSETPRRREMIYTVPNFLTFTRLLLSPVLGYFIIQNDFRTAFGLFLYMGATDFVDGYIARRFDQRTLLGTVMDPLADKVLMATMTIALTSADRLPLYLGVLILGRDFALVVAAFYMRWRSLPQPRSFAKYWDLSLPTAEITPSNLSKANTLLQLVLVGSSLALPAFSMAEPIFMEPLRYIVAVTTVGSAIQYVLNPPIRVLPPADQATKDDKKDN